MYNSSSSEAIQRTIELLAPARDAVTAIAAIDHGADAVYMGAYAHGARRQAANALSDIAAVVEYAHRFNVRVYVTVNTIVYDYELADVEQLVWNLYRIGVDAIIVQDMALLEMSLPPIALHASTQCDIRTPAKARFLQDAGFSQLVLPRELTLGEIAAFRQATEVPLEAFVHGALCVSYSGDCQASYVVTGRSANRGDCAQICRLPFDLEDASGRKLVRGKHLLSLKDMSRIDYLAEMLEAGISSFKIEGRLKDANYVRNVVAAYSRALNDIVKSNPDKYRRASRGRVEYTFTPDVAKSFNRGFTSYFLNQPRPVSSMASVDSPKWTGERIGTVKAMRGDRVIVASLDKALANGDGLGYFDTQGQFVGFRLNRVEGTRLYAACDVNPACGTVLYRNFDKIWNDMFLRQTAVRKITVSFNLRVAGNLLVLGIVDEDGVEVSVSVRYDMQKADKPQFDNRSRILSKLGDTIFELGRLKDDAGDAFIPASVLTRLRRDAVDALLTTYSSTYRYDHRRKCKEGLVKTDSDRLSRHDNIANHLAESFYRRVLPAESVRQMPVAIESASGIYDNKELRVMQTRYCLRRELGACLKTDGRDKLPSPLFITSGLHRFRIDFDCALCRMSVIKTR